MQQQCSNANHEGDGWNEFFSNFFSEEQIRKMTEPLTEKTDRELEENIAAALRERKEATGKIAKNLAVLRSRMSDYRFRKMLVRLKLSKTWAKLAVQVGTECLMGGR